MPEIYIIHENNDWTAPLRRELEARGLPYREWFLDWGVLDLSSTPPEGVFYNRMSASSHTRNHRFAAEYTLAVLAWLERHGRVVANDSRAMQLEISKAAQYPALEAHGIRTPRTVAAVGREQILEAARPFHRPFITKHNRAGKGLGVRLFESRAALKDYVESEAFEEPIDGITLIQEYIESPDATITRCEFVGGEFLYAVRVDTSKGFELCPADVCETGDAFPPTSDGAGRPASRAARPRFEILEGFEHPILERFAEFLGAHGMKIAAIEFIRDRDGRIYAYDVNVNTNYNSEAEARASKSGMGAVASYLGRELARLTSETPTRRLETLAS